MTQNKLLATTVALALSMGGGVLQAGTFTLNTDCVNPNTNITCNSTPYVISSLVALELFDDSGVDTATILPRSIDGTFSFNVIYTFSADRPIQEPTSLTFTVENGSFDLLGGGTNLETYQRDETTGEIVESDVGISNARADQILGEDVTEIEYTLEVSPFHATFPEDGIVVFRDFRIDVDSSALSSNGGRVSLRLEVNNDEGLNETKTISLIEAVPFYDVSLSSVSNAPDIDVTTGSSKFTSDPNYFAPLGRINFEPSENSASINGFDMLNTYDGTANSVLISMTDGPFGLLEDVGETQHIFVAAAGATTCEFDSTVGGEEATVIGDQANWGFSSVSNGQLICIDVGDSNEDEIVETDEAPSGTIRIEYNSSTYGTGNTITYGGSLTHLQRNGAVCTVYNVTDANRLDKSNIRISNFSSREATILLTLEDMDGNTVFNQQNLSAITGNDFVAAKETVYVNSEDLVDLLVTSGSDNTEWGRGVLTIIGDVLDDDLDVELLLRSNAVQGNRTLMNMSVGASGSGCE